MTVARNVPLDVLTDAKPEHTQPGKKPAWLRVNFPYYDLPKIAESFIPAN